MATLAIGHITKSGDVIVDSSWRDEAHCWLHMTGFGDGADIEFKKSQGERVCLFEVIEHKPSRSIAQNRLYWGWLTDCERTREESHKGSTKEEWHKRFKGDYLIHIYERDIQSYSELMQGLRDLYRTGLREEAVKMRQWIIEHHVSTTEADVSQFSEYLKAIEGWCAWQGIVLRTDARLYAEAMG